MEFFLTLMCLNKTLERRLHENLYLLYLQKNEEDVMKIEMTAEELAALVVALQERQKEDCNLSDQIAEKIKQGLQDQTQEHRPWK